VHIKLQDGQKVGSAKAKGIGRKNFRVGGGNGKKQDRKIAPLNFFLLYHYHVWKSRGHGPPAPAADAHGQCWSKCAQLWHWKLVLFPPELQFVNYSQCLSYYSNTEAVQFASLLSSWTTTTGRLLGLKTKMRNTIKCLSQGHNDALPHR